MSFITKSNIERLWTHIVARLSDKADVGHTHDGMYYTEAEIDSKLSGKSDTSHSHNLADLTADSTHRTVTDAEKATWNAKSSFSGSYNDLTDKPVETTDDDAMDLLYEIGAIEPVVDENNNVLTDENGNILTI